MGGRSAAFRKGRMAASMMQDTHLICSGRMIQMCYSSVPLPTSPAHGLVLKRRGQHERVSMLQISCAVEEPGLEVSTPAEASSGDMLSALRTPGNALATLLFASCVLLHSQTFHSNSHAGMRLISGCSRRGRRSRNGAPHTSG